LIDSYRARMGEKILICVSARQLTAAHWLGHRLTDCRKFSNDDDGIAAFEEFLTPFGGTPAYFIVDAVEEDYRLETLPHALGPDRREMVRRKLRLLYRNTPYTTAWLLGRDTGRRRDDRYLFAALTNPDLIAPWLHATVARRLPVAGVFLLPLLSAALVEKLRVRAVNLLLVAQHSGGLRLTFCRDHQFRLSRLTRADPGRGGNRARFLAEEISNTRIYLHALRVARLDEPLTVILLDHGDELIDAAGHIARTHPSLACVRFGRAEIASRLAIAEPALALGADAIYLHLLGCGTPPGNLAPANVTAGFLRHRMRRGIYAAAATLACGAALWTGINLWLIHDAHVQREEAARLATRLQQQYLEITRQYPAAPTSAENLRGAVEIAARVRALSRTPEPWMRIVSAALERSPGIVIAGLSWKHGVTVIDPGSTGAAAVAAAGTPPPGSNTARRQSGLIEGEVRPFRGDYRAAIQAINAFAGQLAAHPSVAEVRIVKLPLNINPQLALSGNTLEAPQSPGVADFRILMVLKPNA
jgi:hypothetical protein